MRPRRRRLLYAILAAGLTAAMLAPATGAATIEEQRARLPPPAECPDDVEGTWMAIRYEADYSPPEWYHVTLDIRRAAPGSERLEGSMLVHFYYGGPGDIRPPPCRPGQRDAVVFQTAVGKAEAGGRLRFDATSWRWQEAACGGMTGGYNLDHYSGQIDQALHEFQSVNNDGGRAVNEPAVFRRVRCAPETPRPVVDVKPPAFMPERRAGCGRGW